METPDFSDGAVIRTDGVVVARWDCANEVWVPIDPDYPLGKKRKKTKALTLAEYDRKVAKAERADSVTAAIEAQVKSRVWDDPRYWK